MHCLHIQNGVPPILISFIECLSIEFQSLTEVRQRPAKIGVDTDIGMDDFIDFNLVDVEVNDFRLGRKVGSVTGNAIIKTSADGQEQVTLGNGHIGSIGTVHADHAQVAVPLVGNAALPHERRDDRYTQLLYNGTQRVRHSR